MFSTSRTRIARIVFSISPSHVYYTRVYFHYSYRNFSSEPRPANIYSAASVTRERPDEFQVRYLLIIPIIWRKTKISWKNSHSPRRYLISTSPLSSLHTAKYRRRNTFTCAILFRLKYQDNMRLGRLQTFSLLHVRNQAGLTYTSFDLSTPDTFRSLLYLNFAV